MDFPNGSEFQVLTICGSLRRRSYNAALGRALANLAPPALKIAEGPGLGDIPLYNFDAQISLGFPAPVVALGALIRAADGVILLTPEYNYSVSGVLKNAIDWISHLPEQPFAGKPVLIQSVANGVFGGARAQSHLLQIMVFVEALVFNRPEVLVGVAKERIDEATGELTHQPTRNLIERQLAAFAEFIGKSVDAPVTARSA